MNWEEKLDFVLDYLKIRNIQVANEFGVSNGSISQWRNKRAKKLNRVHLLAFERAFNIPISIFEDKNINSKEKIKKILDNRAENFQDNNSINFAGRWNLYAYYNKNILEFNLAIEDGNIYFIFNNSKYNGHLLNISSKEFIVSFENKNFNESFVLIINKSAINSEIFYASLYKNNSLENRLSIALISKKRVDSLEVKYILGDRIKNSIAIDYKRESKIYSFLYDNEKFKSEAIYLKHLIGEWKLYLFDNSSFDILIDEDNRVFLYYKDMLINRGYVQIEESRINILFKKDYKKIYLEFYKDYSDIKIVSYIGYETISNENILSEAILSKKALDKNSLKDVFNSTNKINIDSFKMKILKLLNKNMERVS